MVGFGILLSVLAFTFDGVSYGFAFKKVYPPTTRLRVAVFSIGIVAIILGIARVIRG